MGKYNLYIWNMVYSFDVFVEKCVCFYNEY